MDINHEIIRALGMTLVHSLWQGTVVAVLVLFLLSIAGKSNARFRYVVLFSGLVLLLTGFIATFLVLFHHQSLQSVWSVAASTDSATAYNRADLSWSLTPERVITWVFSILEPAYPVLAIGWLMGFLLIGIRMTGGVVVSRMKIYRSLEPPDILVQGIFDRIREMLNLPEIIRLHTTTRNIGPMVTGVFKPLVIIPVAAVSGLSTEQVEAVLVHELAHIRRFDHIFLIVQAIAGQVLFFHPLIWFLLPEIDRERENCCDDFVLNLKSNPINYIKALTMIQEMNLQGSVPSNALTGKSNHLLNRIKRLVMPEIKHSPAFKLTVTLLFLATVGVSAMTIILTGKPDGIFNERVNAAGITKAFEQPDSTAKASAKKKMKIIFQDDTITEMTVNGKTVKKEDMKDYEEEIRRIHQEMESSQRELEETQRKLKEAQMELEIARERMTGPEGELPESPGLRELDRQLRGDLSQIYGSPDHFKNLWQDEKFREQMKKTQEEARKAQEEMKLKGEEFWKLHQEEFREQMKKAQEEAWQAQEEINTKREEYWQQHQKEYQEQLKKAQEEANKAFEELRKNKAPFFDYPDPFVVPPVEELLPDQPAGKSLNDKLKELEAGE